MSRNKTKVCPQCRKKKPRTKEFFAVARDGRMSWCRTCISSRATAWGRKNKERAHLNRKRWRLKKLYGMTLEEFEARLIAQGNACAICRGSISIVNAHVDHDHSSGAIRDLLCFGCNAGLGNMRDDPKRLRTAAAYLDYHDRKNGKLL